MTIFTTLLVAPNSTPSARGHADRLAIRIDQATGGQVAVEQLANPSEQGLRERLAQPSCAVLHLIVDGTCRAPIRHATVNLDDSHGLSRSVNVVHLGKLAAQHPGITTVILQIPDRPEWRHAGFVLTQLRAGGVPAVLLIRDQPDVAQAVASAFYQALGRGQSLQEAADKARACGHLLSTQDNSVLADVGAWDSRSLQATEPPSLGQQPITPVMSQPTPLAWQEQIEFKRAAGRFDVFLCHNSIDKPVVKKIGLALMQHGVLPWLDEWDLPPGQPWQPLLEQQIERIGAAAVFVGPNAVGPWQQQELLGFLRAFVDRRVPVIPVLLAGIPETPRLPVFLQAMTWVDFRQIEPDPMARLIWGITGRLPSVT